MPKAVRIGKQGSLDLSAEVFGQRFNGSIVHETARSEMNARRRGTAATKTRGMVRGGGAKPWRQKGTGRARQGTIRAPQWAGGGVVFGPHPRHYTFKVNRKIRRAALRSALSLHAERGSIAVLEVADFQEPSTKKAAAALAKWNQAGPTLLVLSEDESGVAKSFRNISSVAVVPASQAGVADVVGAAALVVTEAALNELSERAGGKSEPKAAPKAPKAAPKAAKAAKTSEPDDGAEETS